MKEHQIWGIASLVILCVVFCLIAFLPPFSMTVTFWTAFAAGIAALAVQIYFFRCAFSAGGDAKSRFYSIPIARIGVMYFVVQWILSILEMVFAGVLPGWIAVLVDAVVLAAALLGGIAADAVRDEVIRQDVALKKNVSRMRELQSLVDTLAGQCKDEAVKKELDRLSEEIRYSDPVSSDATAPLEAEMLAQVKEIKNALNNGNTEAVKKMTEKMTKNLIERNGICKLSK